VSQASYAGSPGTTPEPLLDREDDLTGDSLPQVKTASTAIPPFAISSRSRCTRPSVELEAAGAV
jgi:hypothetical protein